jgi:hypothetical protein
MAYITVNNVGILVYPISIAVGLVMDWAVYERITLSFSFFIRSQNSRNYQKTFFPRILITIVGILLCSHGIYALNDNIILLSLGGALFFMSSIYAIVRSFRS